MKISVVVPSIVRTGERRHQLLVRTLSRRSTSGFVELGWQRFACALGRTGSRVRKREGDGASPIGCWPLREAFYRPDRMTRPRTGLPLRALKPNDGWCDDPRDRNYNRPIEHPYPRSAEHLIRSDGLYDLIVVLGYNDAPRIKSRGSAIFLHCAHDGNTPTQGCIAVSRRDLSILMRSLRRSQNLRIA